MAAGLEFLDLRTFIVSSILIEGFLSGIMILYWKHRDSYPGFLIWAIQLIILAMAQINLVLRGIIPDIISIPLANLFTALALLLEYEAVTRYYSGQPADKRWYLILPITLCGAMLGYVVVDSIALRIVFISFIALVLALKIGREFYSNITDDENTFSRLLSFSYYLLAFIFFFRIIDYYLNQTGRTLLEQSAINDLLFLAILILSIVTTLLFIILNFDRMARDRNKAAMEKEQIANRYELAVETAGAGVWEMDQSTLTLIGDDQVIRMAGLRKQEEDTGMALEKIIYPEDLPRLIQEIQSVSHPGENLSSEYRIITNDGEIHYHVSHAKSYEKKGQPGLWLVGLSIDITPLRKTQNALREAMKKLSILSSITRHDILNCATVISMYTGIVLDEITDADMKKKLRIISETGEEITRLIQFTSEYQDLGMHEPLWIDITGILSRETYRSLLTGVSLHLPEPGVRLYVDQMIEKVLYNLIENSVRHGDGIKNISLSYRYEEKDLLVLYEDDGKGIKEGEKSAIFEKGYGKNTGMGLFLSREILAITGLTIKENGEPGRGVRFVIRAKPGSYHDERQMESDEIQQE